MKQIFSLVLTCVLFLSVSQAQTLYFPPVTGTTWSATEPSQLGWNSAYIDTLYNYLSDNNTKAFIVLKDGRIVLEKYFGTFSQDSVWYWASAGKTLTGFAIGLAQQEGKLSISDSTSKYLGDGWTSLPVDKERAITIKNQLTMTTGLDDMTGDPDCTDPTCLQFKADAGTRWAYHTAPYTLLDSVIAKATGQEVNPYIYQHLHAKTGFNGLYVKLGYNNVFYSNARNMARFGLLLLNRGTWADQPILTDTAYFSAMTNTSQDLNKSYGYLTWLNGKSSFMIPQTQIVFPGYLTPSAPADLFAAMGKNGQFINVVPSQNLVWIRMGNAPDNSLVPFLLNEGIWKKLKFVMNTAAGINDNVAGNTDIPDILSVAASPNPFNPSTAISYSIGSPVAKVDIAIYDINGRKCITLFNGERKRGDYTLNWNGKDDTGGQLASGMYICRMQTPVGSKSIKLMLLK